MLAENLASIHDPRDSENMTENVEQCSQRGRESYPLRKTLSTIIVCKYDESGVNKARVASECGQRR